MLGSEGCPICLCSVKRVDERDYGDKKQMNCVRCGPYEISGTALRMLQSRTEHNALTRARMSHAIRVSTSNTNPLSITSVNVDELAEQALPGPQQQLIYLLRWLAGQVGENRFGQVVVKRLESLGGIVGAVDDSGVKRLIDYAVEKGVIEQGGGADELGLSPKGWEEVESSSEEERSETTVASKAAELIRAHCNECGGKRKAFVRATHEVNCHEGEVSWSDRYDILQCCGCDGVSIQRVYRFSEWDNLEQDPITGQPQMVPGTRVTYWPPPTKRKKPVWTNELTDKPLRLVIEEVYEALNSGLIILASIGMRTLLDRAMSLRVGDPKGGFEGKLNLMMEQGRISADQRRTLEAITDAGSAAAHRGFAPKAETLKTIVEIVENFLHTEFVLKGAADEVRAATPPRFHNKR